MTDILADLDDLIIQATKERSHYYVARCATLAAKEIRDLRRELKVIHVIAAAALPSE